MKYLLIMLTALLCNCSPQFTSNLTYRESDKTVLIRVECKNHVETSVIQTLRLARYNDLEKEGEGSQLIVIKARFQELTYQRAMQLINDLKSIPGVFDTQIIKDGVPVKNVR